MTSIESLLLLLRDFNSFSEDKTFTPHSDNLSELSEVDLALISAAKGPGLPRKNDLPDHASADAKKK